MSLETLQSAGTPGDSRLAQEIRSLGPWFHNLHLPEGLETAPDHPLGDFPRFKWLQIASVIAPDLSGWRVLDIGCNAGFYSFELAGRGAEVLGIDPDPRYLRQARWASRFLDPAGRVRFARHTVYDLPRLTGRFDLVLFMGVLYHLRYPLLALEMVAEKVGRQLIFQSLSLPGDEVLATPPDLPLEERSRLLERGWPSMAFVEEKIAGDATNWWVPNRACNEAMLRSVGLRVTTRPGDEIFGCEPAPDRPPSPYLEALAGLTGETRGREAADEP